LTASRTTSLRKWTRTSNRRSETKRRSCPSTRRPICAPAVGGRWTAKTSSTPSGSTALPRETSRFCCRWTVASGTIPSARRSFCRPSSWRREGLNWRSCGTSRRPLQT